MRVLVWSADDCYMLEVADEGSSIDARVEVRSPIKSTEKSGRRNRYCCAGPQTLQTKLENGAESK